MMKNNKLRVSKLKLAYCLILLIVISLNTNAIDRSNSSQLIVGKEQNGPVIFSGPKEQYQGFDRYTITIGNEKATVLCPNTPLAGRQWVIAPSNYTLDSYPVAYIAHTEIELAKRGFYVVYAELGNTSGAPDAIARWDNLYPIMTKQYGMAKKVSLMGLSREGLAIARWAAEHKGKVSALYMDKAVCDFKSWPGGKFSIGKGSPSDWKNLIKLYHFKSEAEALAYKKNPADLARKLAKAHVAIIYVAGETDPAVPYNENGARMEQEYKKCGGIFKLIMKKGEGHHPHGLADQTPIVDFFQQHLDK